MKKYELTTETKVVSGHTLYRIRALVAFGSVDTGELGGWIEKESNLAQDGNAWVYGSARVYGDAAVRRDAHAALRTEAQLRSATFEHDAAQTALTVLEREIMVSRRIYLIV